MASEETVTTATGTWTAIAPSSGGGGGTRDTDYSGEEQILPNLEGNGRQSGAGDLATVVTHLPVEALARLRTSPGAGLREQPGCFCACRTLLPPRIGEHVGVKRLRHALCRVGANPAPMHRRCPLSAACTTSGSETLHTAPCRSRPHCSGEKPPSRSAPLRSLTGSYPPSPARLASADVPPNHPATHAPSAATRSPMHFPRTLSLSVLVLPRERLRLQVKQPRAASLPLPRRRVARPSH